MGDQQEKNQEMHHYTPISIEHPKKTHPLQFALWLIVIILAITFGIHFSVKRYQARHIFHISVAELQKSPWKTFHIKSGDTLLSILKKAGLKAEDYNKIVLLEKAKDIFKKIRPNQVIYLLIQGKNELKELVYHYGETQYLVINKEKDQKGEAIFVVHIVEQAVGKRYELAEGTIQNSLAKSAEVAGLPSKLLYQLTGIFNWEIDFKRDIRSGDQFKVLYEVYYAEHQKIKTGDIVAAEFINHQQKYIAIRYQNKNGSVDYYTPSGKNLKKAFLRAPVRYLYISSPFAARRYHPILHIVRPHEGVDLAAPTGTPIKAAGYGRIVFRGRKGGYGKAIIIYHNPKYTTLYAHMSRFRSGLHVGSHVAEGQVIGYVGQTGLATGPHLHYEFHIYDVPHDPMKVKLPNAAPIPKSEHDAFLAYAKKMEAMLDQKMP